MKKKVALILFCALILTGLSGCKGKKPDRSQGTPGTAPGAIETPSVDLNKVTSVTVNGTVIDKKMIDHETRQHSVQMKMKLPEPQFKMIEPTMRKKAVDSLINRTLLLQRADRAGTRITPEELEAKFVSVRATYPGDVEFQNHIKALGITEEGLKKELEVQLRVQKLLDRDMGDKIRVTDEELEEYRKQNPEQFQDVIDFEEVEEEVRTFLRAGKERGAMEAYYDALRENATITYETAQDRR